MDLLRGPLPMHLPTAVGVVARHRREAPGNATRSDRDLVAQGRALALGTDPALWRLGMNRALESAYLALRLASDDEIAATLA